MPPGWPEITDTGLSVDSKGVASKPEQADRINDALTAFNIIPLPRFVMLVNLDILMLDPTYLVPCATMQIR